MQKLKVALALITRDNDYQREQAAAGEAAARRLGIELQVLYADGDAIAQTKQILDLIHGPAENRPGAIVVEPVGTGMPGVAGVATGSGIGWMVLNRDVDYLEPLRQNCSVPIGSVDTNNLEIGRIQGRQFAALLPGGGSVLYIEGPATDVSRERRAGMEETLPGNIEIRSARGRWTEESGYQILAARLQRHGSQAPNVHLIGCQNDAMAMGARKAVEALEHGNRREAWLGLPFTGVDGVASSGQVWVQKRQMAATIIVPPLAGQALELLWQAISSGTQVAQRTLTEPVSYPAVEELGSAVGTAPSFH